MPLVPSICETNTRFERHSRTLCLFSCYESCAPWSNPIWELRLGLWSGAPLQKDQLHVLQRKIGEQGRAGCRAVRLLNRLLSTAFGRSKICTDLYEIMQVLDQSWPRKNRPVTVTSAKQLQTEEMADPYVPRWVLTGSLLIWGWPLQNVTVMKWLMIPVQGGLLAEVLQISGAGAEGSDWWLTRCSATVAHSCHSAAVATGQAKIIGVILCNFELRHRSAIERSWRSEDRLSLGIPSMATDSWLLVDFDDLIWSATCCGKKPRQCEKRLWRFPLLQLGKLNREVLWLEWCANKIQ